MKIVDMKVTVVGAPWRELTFVELVTDEGLVGLGEARMVNKTETLLACLRELGGRYVIGSDPFNVERLAANIQVAEYGRAGEVAATALSIFDVASWDLIGQSLGVPIYKLLGGVFHERIPAYANGWYRAVRDPATIADLASTVVARGYRAFKLDPFGAAHSELSYDERRRSIDILAAVREKVGPSIEIMLEMHGRFHPAEASRIAELVAPYQPAWIEEPVPPENPAALRRVRAATNLPIATGERLHAIQEFRELFETGCVDIVQADLTHFGGFLAMKRLAGWADAYYLPMAPHNVGGPVATMANVHFAVATPNYKVLEHFNDFADPWVKTLVEGGPEVDRVDGSFAVPTRPGLGLKLNHEVCAEHPPTGGRIKLFEEGWERRR